MIAIAEEFTSSAGIEVYHEIHRGKFSFAAHIIRGYLPDCTILAFLLYLLKQSIII